MDTVLWQVTSDSRSEEAGQRNRGRKVNTGVWGGASKLQTIMVIGFDPVKNF